MLSMMRPEVLGALWIGAAGPRFRELGAISLSNSTTFGELH